MLKLTPLKEQAEAIKFFTSCRWGILGFAPGMGKTLVALAIADKFYKEARTLIIAPASLLTNWEYEIEKTLGERKIKILRTQKEIRSYAPQDEDYILVSYAQSEHLEHLFKWKNILVLDEMHYLKNLEAKRTKKIFEYTLEHPPRRLLGLTGTPVKNRVTEFYSLMALCYSSPFIESDFLSRFSDFYRFADFFSYRFENLINVGHRKIRLTTYRGIKNEDTLKTYLSPIYFKRERTSAPVTYTTIQLKDSKNTELLKAFQEFEATNRESSGIIKAKMLSAIEKAKLTAEYCKELLDSGAVENLIVFSDHRESARIIAQELKTQAITGEDAPQKRGEVARKFQEGHMPVLVATTGSMGVGFTLTRAHHLVFNDFPWVPGDFDQAVGRINRTGQTRQCVVHLIFGSREDNLIWKMLENKRQVIKQAT